MSTHRSRRIFIAAMVSALVLSGCTGGHNAVDQTAGGYHYTGATASGKLIAVAKRHVAGNARAPYLANGSGTFSLTATQGQIVVLNYWAAWCGPCRTESPEFDKIYRDTRTRGVTFIGIDTKETDKSGPLAFIRDRGISYPNVFDPSSKTAIQIGRIPVSGLPNTVLIDKHGRVAAVYTGPVLSGDLSPVLDELISET